MKIIHSLGTGQFPLHLLFENCTFIAPSPNCFSDAAVIYALIDFAKQSDMGEFYQDYVTGEFYSQYGFEPPNMLETGIVPQEVIDLVDGYGDKINKVKNDEKNKQSRFGMKILFNDTSGKASVAICAYKGNKLNDIKICLEYNYY